MTSPTPSAASCPTCRLPTAYVPLDRECPFCHSVFSRVDGARRHAQRCRQRDGRDVPPAKRGRKGLSCDHCSKVKVHCNAKEQTPCGACFVREIECTFSRYCACSELVRPAEEELEHPKSVDDAPLQAHREGAVPLSFLLNSTDATQDFVTEQAVGTEPEGALLGPIRLQPPQARAGGNDAPPDYIDPSLLFSTQEQDSTHLPFGLQIGGQEEDILSSLLTSRSHGDRLASRVKLLESDLTVHGRLHSLVFDPRELHEFLSISNVYSFATTFCRKRHYRYPVIYWPTFALEEASLPLLLVVSLTGASYSYRPGQEPDHVKSARRLYSLADSYIFRQLSRGLDRGVHIQESLQLYQAALLMYGLQTPLTGDAEVQRKVITQRLPVLVSALRRLDLVGCQHNEIEDWYSFLQSELIIRLVAWTFCADCLATLSCNNPPLFSIFEMAGHLPCDPELWDTESSTDFELLRAPRQRHSSYSLADITSAFLNLNSGILPDIDLEGLPPFHLHIILCAFQPLIYNLHITFQLPSQASRVLEALASWRRLWDTALARIPEDSREWLGVARYVPGIEHLSRRIVEIIRDGEGGQSAYLHRKPRWGTRDLHEFIKSFVGDR